ncbi:hypothetical protein SLS62_004927 [Diatrype stigma]|uniref:Cytochrome P450 n=1 Tax=Diatrype stigma TaxID=117547 RepID=A0AAN9V2A6_9PEZI
MALLMLSEGHRVLWLALFGASLCYYFIFRAPAILRNGAPLRKPPDTLPLVGNGILFLQARQKLFSWFIKCQRQFGLETFQISVPTLPPGVVINDPKNLDFVFKHEGIFSKGTLFKRLSWDLFGNGIINADGELWKIQRKAGLAFLNNTNLRVLTDIALPQYLAQSVKYLRKCGENNTVVDFQVVFHEISSQLMGKMAYNMEMHADDDFTLAFEHASGATAERFQNPLWFLTEPFLGTKFRKSLSTIRSFGQRIVESAVNHHHEDGKTGPDPLSDNERLDRASGSLIQSLLEALGGDQGMVMDSALNYLSAGRDTVAQALTWTMYLLIKHPFAIDKIRDEVEESVNKAQNNKDGTYLPADTIVFWCLLAFGQSKMIWGDDAGSFRPERWLTEEGNFTPRSAAEFPVFNGGKRTCLGQRMAELMTVQVVATMVSEFDFVPAYETERVSKSR